MADWKSSQEFLKEFYASPIVNEDTISAKIKRIFLPKSRKASALKELAGDLSGEGRAGDIILDNDMFEMDTEIWKKQEKRRKLLVVLCSMAAIVCLGYFGVYNWYNYRTADNYKQLSELKDKEPTASDAPAPVIHYTAEEGQSTPPPVLDEYKNLLNKIYTVLSIIVFLLSSILMIK